MTVTINGSGSITEEITIDGVKVGQGGGNVATNTAVGASALAANEAGGNNNTAVGYESLNANTTGDFNTALGSGALDANTTANSNTAVGYQAGYTNQTGTANTFLGYQAGYTSASGINTLIGWKTGFSLTTGTNNTFVGVPGPNDNCGSLITTGSKNTIIGAYSGNQDGLDIRTASNYIVLSDGDGNVRLYFNGNDLISPGVHGNTTANAANVAVLSAGNLRRSTSSRRYKNTISDATHGLAELLTLRPVTYKGNNDGETVFGGLIAEEVHDAGLTEFVQYAADGTPDSLAYGNMVSLCVKAIQELSAQVTALQAEVNALKGQ
jgi:hypothetical protein